MSKDTDPLTREEFHRYMGMYTEAMADSLNKAFGHVYRRFDDLEERMEGIERRLESLEGTVHKVKNDTRMIKPIFEWARTDNDEFARLKVRVDELERQS